MGETAVAVMCIISFVVHGLGNGVIADDVSAKNGVADAGLTVATVLSSLALTTSGDTGTERLEAEADSQGATETTLHVSVAELPTVVDTIPQPSAYSTQTIPSSSENVRSIALEETNQTKGNIPIEKSSSVDKAHSNLTPGGDLSHDEDEEPATSIHDKIKSQENSSSASVDTAPEPTAAAHVNVTTPSTVDNDMSPGMPNAEAELKKDPVAATVETYVKENNSSIDGDHVSFIGMDILTQEHARLPIPTAASLVVNNTSANSSSDAALVLENIGRKLVVSENLDPDSQTSSSVEIQSAATVLHILTQENKRPLPPTVASLVDGKSILPVTPDTELPLNTQPSQDQNNSIVNDILPVAANSTNSTTAKPSKKVTVEKCPADSALPCVSKCCPFGFGLVNDKCRPSSVRFIPQFTLLVNGFNDTKPENETEKMAKYNLIAQNICVKNRYRLEPGSDSVDEFHLLFNGSLWLPATKPHHSMKLSDEYCMEVFEINGEEVMLPLVCFNIQPVVESSFHFMVYPIGLLISVPFLLATFIVYNMIPELRNLHGKSLSCYVLCLMMAYIFLAVVQLGGQGFDTHVCVGVAFAIQFSFIACFFWLNVLCFDTWRNVFLHGDLGYTMEKSQERSFFIFYSIYAWSFTIVLIIVTMVMNFAPTIPSSYLKPGIGEKTCWFNTEREAFPYFYGPVGVLIIINVLLFIMTAIKLILEHHKEAFCVRTPTQTFQLCLTLFFIMGINWVMEIISWAAGGPPFIWYITDICNTLQGIFIFVVFVMDERVRGLCKTELFPRLQEFFAACCPQKRTRRASSEPNYDSINGQEMVYMFKKEDIEH